VKLQHVPTAAAGQVCCSLRRTLCAWGGRQGSANQTIKHQPVCDVDNVLETSSGGNSSNSSNSSSSWQQQCTAAQLLPRGYCGKLHLTSCAGSQSSSSSSSSSSGGSRGYRSAESSSALCGAHLQHLLRLQPPCHCGTGHVTIAQLQQAVAAAAEQQLGGIVTGWRGDWSEPPPCTRVQLFVSGLPTARPTHQGKGGRGRGGDNDDANGCLASAVQQRLAQLLQPLAPECSGGWSRPTSAAQAVIAETAAALGCCRDANHIPSSI
jgi:hypothetical protein